MNAQLLLDRATFACEGDELQTHMKAASHAVYKWKITQGRQLWGTGGQVLHKNLPPY